MVITLAQREFLEKIAPIAVRQCKKHDGKIFASVCIAQAIHETGWGSSKKMASNNGYFGIKVGASAYHFGTAWKGAAYNTRTTEYYDPAKQVPTKINDWFRAYSSMEDSVEDYYDMLCHCSRYRPALNQKTPRDCIEKIVAGGYATGPSYAQKIMDLINKHELYKYDGDMAVMENPYKLRVSFMKQGSAGESVKWLQWELNRNGADLVIDGKFGKLTKLAVLLYQKQNGLVQDGICGKITINSLTAKK